MDEWKTIDTAPKDKSWVLVRGYNSAGQPMVPVVAAWMPHGATHQGWVDSGSFKPLDGMLSDNGEWMPLPSPPTP